MQKKLTATLFCAVSGLGLATAALASEVSTGRQAFAIRAEQAVVQGSVAKLEALRSNLERSDKDERYNLAYLDWRTSQLLPHKSKKEKRQLLKRAEEQLDQLLDTDSGNAEAHALQGSVIGERITGMWSGIRLGKKSKKSLDRALELGPDNPRIALQRGISFFFTPKSFGGGILKAETELRRALDLFAREPSGKPWPNWGQVDVLAWLGQTLAKLGKPEEARASYEAALKMEPGHTWIRDELLPGLDNAAKRK